MKDDEIIYGAARGAGKTWILFEEMFLKMKFWKIKSPVIREYAKRQHRLGNKLPRGCQ